MPFTTAIITGASAGIGKAIALKFAQEGLRLAICSSKSENELLLVKKEAEALGVPCLAFTGDMGNSADCEAFFKEISSLYGSADLLVNNAGISYIGLLQEMPFREWDRIIRVNLSSAFYCSKLALPPMIRHKKGRIINITSVWGLTGASCEVAYSTSKGGLNAFTKALAKEVAPSNIQVNAISCGAVNTRMNQWLTDEERKALMDEIPAGRLGEPDEVAALAWQLATAPSYLTGQVISLDGGWI